MTGHRPFPPPSRLTAEELRSLANDHKDDITAMLLDEIRGLEAERDQLRAVLEDASEYVFYPDAVFIDESDPPLADRIRVLLAAPR